MSDKQLPAFWFGSAPELLPDEKWVAHHPANRTQGTLARGGGLHFTTARVLFRPNVIDALFAAESFSCQLADIERVGVEEARWELGELFSGGLRSRLRIELRGGGVELFVMNSPEKIAAELGALIGKG